MFPIKQVNIMVEVGVRPLYVKPTINVFSPKPRSKTIVITLKAPKMSMRTELVKSKNLLTAIPAKRNVVINLRGSI